MELRSDQLLKLILIKGNWRRGSGCECSINVDINQHLTDGLWMTLAEGCRIWITCRFEKLPDYCYVCGCLNHMLADCDRIIKIKMENKEVTKKVGTKLRAVGRRIARNNNSIYGRMYDSTRLVNSVPVNAGENYFDNTAALRPRNTHQMEDTAKSPPSQSMLHTVVVQSQQNKDTETRSAPDNL